MPPPSNSACTTLVAEYRLTPAAERDLEEIWVYTLQRWGADQADRHAVGRRDVARAEEGIDDSVRVQVVAATQCGASRDRAILSVDAVALLVICKVLRALEEIAVFDAQRFVQVVLGSDHDAALVEAPAVRDRRAVR